jgi:2-polyprenyl-6-methoxyphenol hydroxylase-like FAD-dependent oxidoreductase
MTNKTRAVVVGASMAGLCAAAALADSFDEVTVIERDVLPDGPVDRRGVPQGKHQHVLQAGGLRSLSDLFPGFEDDLATAGAARFDVQSDVHWHLDGWMVKPAPSGIIAYGASRRLLEHVVRTRVRALPRVEIRDGWNVLDVTTTADRRTVTGVRVSRAEAVEATEVRADLVVDASGRAARSSRWLTALGFPAPTVTRVPIDITYVTREYRREPQHLDGRASTAFNAFPGSPHCGALLAVEDDTFIFTAGAVHGQEPPMNDADLPAYVERFAPHDFADFVKTAEQITEPVRTRFPASVRAHYEKLGDFPAGYLVVGDAVCSFNPAYGQGMSVAAAEAVLLRDLLRADRARLAERFFTGAAAIIDIPWTMTVNADLRFPEAAAPRSEEAEQFNAYLRQIYQAASSDAEVGAALLRVVQLVDPPDRLAEPAMVERVMLALSGT